MDPRNDGVDRPPRSPAPPASGGDGASPHLVTRVLQDAESGERDPDERLLPMLYDELRRIARRRMRRTPPGNTFTPTALVHEAWIKLVGHGEPAWDGSRHFFAAASRAMRNILVDQARRKSARRHGGGSRRESLDAVDLAIEPPAIDVLAPDEALADLEREEPDSAEIVTLHFFAGLSLAEIAELHRTSLSTVKRRWRLARAWLHRALDADAMNRPLARDG
jgi:RNA polymerase sigma factor (TIGR02999 family)